MTTYKILDEDIQVSTGIENVQYIEKIFYPYITPSADMMKNWYNSQGDCVRVLNGIENIEKKIVLNLLDEAVSVLTSNKIYTIDKDSLGERLFYNCFDELDSTAQKMADEYCEIEGDKQSAIEYRRIRKATRERWQGVGIGISGAITASAKAGAMNAVSGLGHSLFNAAGNIVSSAGASAKKIMLYSKCKDDFVAATRKSIWRVMAEMRNVLREEKKMPFEFQSDSNQEKGSSILKNFKSGNIPKSCEREMLAEALKLNYYNHEIYETIWIYFGDKTGDLVRMALLTNARISRQVHKYMV